MLNEALIVEYSSSDAAAHSAGCYQLQQHIRLRAI